MFMQALGAETALHRGLDPGAPGEPGERYQVVVHVDATVLADPEAPGQSLLEGGTHVSAETSRRLACDASRVVMRHDVSGRVGHHHRAVHEDGYQVERQPDGELRFRRPDGRPLPDVATPPAIPDDPVQALRARNEAAGLHLHARTACPSWLGEHLDVGWAIDVLHPRALRPLASGE